jgi:hypothetical protein
MAGLELEGDLNYVQFWGTNQDLQENLEARRPELDIRDRLLSYQEEAAQRIGGLPCFLEDKLGEVLGNHRHDLAQRAREASVAPT